MTLWPEDDDAEPALTRAEVALLVVIVVALVWWVLMQAGCFDAPAI